MMVFAFTLVPDTHNTDHITMAGNATAITITQTNIAGTNGSGGTGTIIGITMIANTTGTEASRFLSDKREGLSQGWIATNDAIVGPDRCAKHCNHYPEETL
jgi:hypothetical protein